MTLLGNLRPTAAVAALVVAAACQSSAPEPGPEATPPAGDAAADDVGGMEDRWVERGDHRIHVREQAGEGPTIVLLHGFPDNHHLYDRLVPHLAGRHVVVFDFLGWGESDKPVDHDYTFAN